MENVGPLYVKIIGTGLAAGAMPYVIRGKRQSGRSVQGRIVLCRPDRRFRLQLSARPGSLEGGRKGVGRQGEDHLRREVP